ncbi:MAG: hypothetical protein GC147_07080 [Porphyrobacter sp.]|nr:hypothetical protein [Porphyrobacter sp.]
MVQADDGQPATARYSPQTVHLIRTAQVNTLTLSRMADQKAQILMGASFVVLSLVITAANTHAIDWSMLCLAVTAFLSSICAVVAILPKPGPPALDRSRYNHLFFGHFALSDEASWTEDMLTGLQDEETLYRMMLRDLYQNGVVLRRRKYRFLYWAYRIFLAGLALTLLVYLLEVFAVLPRPGA